MAVAPEDAARTERAFGNPIAGAAPLELSGGDTLDVKPRF